jgi:hypothetical protein
LEYLSGHIRIRDILLHQNNWFSFWRTYASRLRESIIDNITKVLVCKTKAIGFQTLRCLTCGYEKIIKHTCKSRFCSSCGKKATEQWIEKNLNALPKVPWQQITFTLPKELRELFWLNRELFNDFFPISAKILTEQARKQKVIPGIFSVLHSFGRDLKTNVHFHVLVSIGGLNLLKTEWINKLYFDHAPLKTMWRYRVITLLRKKYKDGDLILPKSLGFIKYDHDFNKWSAQLYNINWVVHLAKPEKNHKRSVKYIARYLKRPPISETNIKEYDGEFVTFVYRDHYSGKKQSVKMPVFKFIARLIRHIPDKNFRLIRYYNWLSNRTRGKLLPLIETLLGQAKEPTTQTDWRTLFIKSFNIDPKLCPNCKTELKLSHIFFGERIFILTLRAKKYLANNFQKI